MPQIIISPDKLEINRNFLTTGKLIDQNPDLLDDLID